MDARDARQRLEHGGEEDGALALARHAQRQRAQPAQREPRRERIHVAAEDGAHLSDRRERALRPDDRAADDVAVPREVLGDAVHDEIGAERERPHEEGRREGGVDDERQAAGARERAERAQIRHAQERVRERLDEQDLRVRAHGRRDGRDVPRGREARAHAEPGPEAREQIGRAAVDAFGRQHLAAVARREQRRRDGRHAGREDEPGLGALELGHGPRERLGRRVAVARVDVRLAARGVRRARGVGVDEVARLIERRRGGPLAVGAERRALARHMNRARREPLGGRRRRRLGRTVSPMSHEDDPVSARRGAWPRGGGACGPRASCASASPRASRSNAAA